MPQVFEAAPGGVCQSMIITVGGNPGSGTTTLSAKLCDAFKLTHVYAGQIFRDMAAEAGMSLAEFGRKAESDETIDCAVDEKQKELAQANTVVEGRMAAHFVEADVKIWLLAPLKVRAARIARRENSSYEESLEKITKREASEKKRYKMYYDTDIDDLSVYDLVINTALWDAEGVFSIVRAAIEVRVW